MARQTIPQTVALTLALLHGGGPAPAPAGRADEGAAVQYEYKEDLNREIEMIRGSDRYFRGKLDRAGNFIPHTLELRRKAEVGSGPVIYIVNRPDLRGRDPSAKTERVYELRSGALVPGDLDLDGNFKPTIGERIIDVKEYRFRPGVPRIYNLPGYFIRKDKLNSGDGGKK